MSTTIGTASPLQAIFREAVSADAAEIHSLKPWVRSKQRAGSVEAPTLQSKLARLRRQARARHVTYSLWKGRCWAEIENNRPDGDPQLAVDVAKAWTDAAAAAGETNDPPHNLLVHIARWL